MEITDETLMAYADGELSPSETRRVADAIASDADVARRARLFVHTRSSMGGLKPDPVPDALAARISAMAAAPQAEAANVIALPRRRISWQLPTAAAAAIALAVGLGAGATLRPPASFGTIGSALTAALDTVPSGQSVQAMGGSFAAISTFRDGAGELCREFEFDRQTRITSVACRSGDAWEMRFASGGSAEGGYAPVSGSDALEAWFAGAEAGPPLDPEAEAEVLKGF